MQRLANIFWLGIKELRSLGHDYVLLGLIIWAFSFAIYAQAQSQSQELHNASVAIADEDSSTLSRRIAGALLPPYFKPPLQIVPNDIDRLMDTAQYTFVIDIPPHFERDVLAGHRPEIQINADATVMMQAGIGAGYLERILAAEIARFLGRTDATDTPPVNLVIRVAFNPNVTTSWFTSVMGIINNITMLAVILAGAALIREREHGTMDHLLVMPLTPFEIAAAKVWANGLVITLAVGLSLTFVVRLLLRVPIAGSVPLFLVGVMTYLFFATAIGIFLGTVARSMPQLGLLFVLIVMPLNILSGSNTPLESMPLLLQRVMILSPSTHFVSLAQSILYRGAAFNVVWHHFAAVAAFGGLFFIGALIRFRRVSAVLI